ncbi:MAG: DUF4345 family protein [Myxococcota bacterium]
MFERGVLILSALIWLPYGLYCFVQPGMLADAAGVVATTPTGTTEIRAMYGGLQAAMGLLALAALFRERLIPGVLLTLVFLTGGLAATRLAGVFIDGSMSQYTGGGLGFEIVSCAVSLFALSRIGRGASAA